MVERIVLVRDFYLSLRSWKTVAFISRVGVGCERS